MPRKRKSCQGDPPVTNTEAGQLLRELREDLFLTRDEMPRAMRKKGVPNPYVPCSKTLWRIEVLGAVPSERIKFGLARFHDRSVSSIWSAERPALEPLAAAS